MAGAALESCNRGPAPPPSLFGYLPWAAKGLCLCKLKCPETGAPAGSRARSVGTVALACLPSSPASLSPSPSEVSALSETCVLGESREETEEDLVGCDGTLDLAAGASWPSCQPLESGARGCGSAGGSRGDPPWGGESLRAGAEALEFSSPTSEWGALRAGKAGFAPCCPELLSRRAPEAAWRLGHRAGRAWAGLLGRRCSEAASLAWREPVAGSSASWSSESLSAELEGRLAGRWGLPSVGVWGAEETEAQEGAPKRGWEGSQDPDLSTPSFRGSVGVPTLTEVLPEARTGWTDLLGGLCCRFWSWVSEGIVGGSPWESSFS